MYKSFITHAFIITLTGTALAAEKQKHSVSSSIIASAMRSAVRLDHASKQTPHLSVSRDPGGMGSALKPGFLKDITKHPTIGTVSPGTVAPGMPTIDLSKTPVSGIGDRGSTHREYNGELYRYGRDGWEAQGSFHDQGQDKE
jgi:hypothetical protein